MVVRTIRSIRTKIWMGWNNLVNDGFPTLKNLLVDTPSGLVAFITGNLLGNLGKIPMYREKSTIETSSGTNSL